MNVHRYRPISACILMLLAVAALTAVVTVTSADSADADDPSCGDGVVWSYDAGTLTISYTGTGTGRMNDFSTMQSDTPWLQHRLEITSIVVGEGVTSIGEWAFGILTKAGSVTLADTVKYIGPSSFYACSGITSLTMPKNLEAVGQRAFIECTGLENVTFSDKVRTVEDNQFLNCSALVTVDLGNSPVTLNRGAFSNDDKLKTVNFGNRTNMIGEYAFVNCKALESAVLPDTVNSIGMGQFSGCASLETLIFPSGLTEIPMAAFDRCTSLKSLTIPDSVTSIGMDQFEGCSSLEHVTFGDGLLEIGKEQFQECTALKSVAFPDSVRYIRAYAFAICESLGEATVGRGMLSMDYGSFFGCPNLKKVTFRCLADPVQSGSFLLDYAETVEGEIIRDTQGDYEIIYNTLSDYAALIKYTGTQADLDLSSVPFNDTTYRTYVVNNFALADNTDVRHLTFGDTVVHIGPYAIQNTQLESISFGKGISVIWPGSVSGYDFFLDDELVEVTPENIRGYTYAGKDGRMYGYTALIDLDGGISSSLTEDRGWTDEGGTVWFRQMMKDQAIKVEDPVKEGYAFLGWTQEIPSAATKQVNTKALWGRLYTVTFDVQGHGTAPDNQRVIDGNKVADPGLPSVSGFIFGGWYADAECSEDMKWDFDSDVVRDNFTLYAKWTPLSKDSNIPILVVLGVVIAAAFVGVVFLQRRNF